MVSKSDFGTLLDHASSATIPSGQQLSDIIEVAGMTLLGIRLPASFTGTTMSLLESDSTGGTFRDVYNTSGSLMTFSVGANRTVLFNPADLAGLGFIKLKSGSAEGAQRTISCIMRAI